MAGINPTTSLTFSGQYNSKWFALNDIKKPDIQKATIDKYGKAFEAFEILELMGNTIDMPNEIKYIYEKESIEKLVTVDASGIAQTAAGAAITFTPNVSDFDSGAVTGNTYIRKNDVITISRQFLLNSTLFDANYWVQSVNASTGLVTAIPFNNNSGAGAVTTPSQLIASGVPAGTLLAVSGNAFGRGSSAPKGQTIQWYKRQYRTTIIRDTFDIEGGNESDLWIDIALDQAGMPVPLGTPGARNGFIMLGQSVIEHQINRSANNACLMGQLNDNTNLVDSYDQTGTTPILGTQGIIPTAAILGQQAPYTGVLDATNFDDIVPLMISEGLTSESVMGLCGDLYYADFQRTMKDQLKEFGHDKIMTSLHDVGLNFRSFETQGIRFYMRPLSNFSNPNNWGAAIYNDYYRRLGVLIPMDTNEVRMGSEDAKNTKIGSLTLGYKNKNAENRRRVFGIVNGMTGQAGHPILNDVDRLQGYYLSEFALIYTKANQTILQYRQ